MKKNQIVTLVTGLFLSFHITTIAQFPLPPQVPIWDGNKVELTLHKIATGIYAIQPTTVESETTQGIPQITLTKKHFHEEAFAYSFSPVSPVAGSTAKSRPDYY